MYKTNYPRLKPGQESFSAFQVGKILDNNPRTIKTLMAKGFITNGTRVARGDAGGYKTVFSRHALKRIAIFFKLKDHFKNETAAKVANDLQPEDMGLLLAIHDSNVECPVLIDPENPQSRTRAGEVSTVIVNLPKICQQVDERIAEYYQ